MLSKLFQSLSFRLQGLTIFLSVVGVVFGMKSYDHIRDAFGSEASMPFMQDLIWQLVIAFVLNAIVGLIIYQIVTSPVKKLSRAMRSLTEGDLDVEIPYTQAVTEIGSMARKVKIFQDNAIKMKQLAKQNDEMQLKIEAEKKQALQQLAGEFNQSVNSVVLSVSTSAKQMELTANSLAQTAERSSTLAESLEDSSANASSNIQALNGAVQELSGSIENISSQAGRAMQIVDTAVGKASSASKTAQDLVKASNQIGNVVSLINDIASQINLLALNATIEAARAGDAGKGFAVVASEVKNLANQTTQATEDIVKQIQAIQSTSHTTVDAINSIGDIISEISQISSTISSAVEMQSVATQQMTVNARNASDITGDVSRSVGQVATSAGNTGAAAEQMLGAVQGLIMQSNILSQEINKFLSRLD